jgi:TolB-like protein
MVWLAAAIRRGDDAIPGQGAHLALRSVGGSVQNTMRITPVGLCTVVVWLAACAGGRPGNVSPERAAARDAAHKAVVNEQSLDAAGLDERTLGIPPFAVQSRDTALAALGYGLADLLTTDLARSGELEVVDRIRLQAVLQEIHLVEAGRIDTATAPRIGRLVQARRLVLGSLNEGADGRLAVNADVADVATGELQSAVSAQARLEDILRAEKELAFRIFERLGVTLSPAERTSVEQLPTKNVTALLAYSRGVRFEAEGRYAEAAREYHQAVQLDPGFQAAAEHLESVEQVPATFLPPTQQASAGSDRARGVVTDRINDQPFSPLGSQLIVAPGEGGADLQAPATVIIVVTVPE